MRELHAKRLEKWQDFEKWRKKPFWKRYSKAKWSKMA